VKKLLLKEVNRRGAVSPPILATAKITPVTIPVIASLNCVNPARWVSFARKIEATGVDGIELNIYDLPDADDGSSADIEKRHLDMIAEVSAEVRIPVAVKISPFYTSIPDFVRKLAALDIQAVVMFNRFFQPDIEVGI